MRESIEEAAGTPRVAILTELWQHCNLVIGVSGGCRCNARLFKR